VVLCQEWASRNSCARRAREQTLEILQGFQREVGMPLRAPPAFLPTLRGVDGWVLDNGIVAHPMRPNNSN
jgi:hypothetical protein